MSRIVLSISISFFDLSNLGQASVLKVAYTVKPLNSEHLRVLKNLPVIDKCPLSRGNLIKIVKFGT